MNTPLFFKLFLVFLISGLSTTAQTFTTIVDDWVPDNGTTMESDLNISGLPGSIDPAFGLVQVCINMNHPWDSDMDVRLKAPDGSVFLLFSGVGGDGDNFTDCCLRTDASEFIYNNGAPFSGTFLPMGNMGVVNNGQDPNGEWSLILYDTYAFADQGYLLDWSITFENNAPAPFPFDSTNIPIVKILTGGVYIPSEPKVNATLQIINHGYNEINHYYDTDYEYEGEILVELQGFTGPWYPKKNYDFDLIDENGIEIDTTLLGMPAENDWILKAEYLDPTLMYNNIAYGFSRAMGRYAPRTIYCELFLDGEYQGVFSLTEKIKRNENRVDIAKLTPQDLAGDSLSGGYIIEMNHNGAPGAWDSQYLPINYSSNNLPVQFKNVYPKASEIMPVQFDYIKAYVDSFEFSLHNWNFADPENGYRKWIDENSFIDFMLVNEVTTNYDSYGRSTFMYKEKNTDGGKLNIGPPWDYDRGFCCTENWVWEQTHPGWPFPDWWSIFHDDSLYTNRTWCRWNELREVTWSNDEFLSYTDSLRDYLSDAAVRNYSRWPELGVTDWNQNVNNLQNIIVQRLAWMDANISGTGPCVPSIENESTNTETFESEIFPPACWTTIDADGDQLSWNGAQPVSGYESDHSAFSYSFMNTSPDNYLVLPKLIPGENENLSWYVAGSDDNFSEHYQVVLSTTGNNIGEFSTVLWDENLSGSWWRYRIVDLSAWEGQEIFIAFRHFDSANNMILKIDEIIYPTLVEPGADCSVSIEENSVVSFIVYPNPVTDLLYVETNGKNTFEKIVILDVTGRKLFEFIPVNSGNSAITIPFGNFPNGIYFIEGHDSSGTFVNRKFVKE